MISLNNINVKLDYTQAELFNIVSTKLKIEKSDIKNITIAKKSVDARKKNNIMFVLTLDVEVKNEKIIDDTFKRVLPYKYNLPKLERTSKYRPVVVGMGPAGMFAALILAYAGLNPIVVERGKAVEERRKDINNFWVNGKLNTSSNVQFGEGGAGTFSDGKLTTGTKDERGKKVLEEFFLAGAPEEILYLAKPHIGTDNLRVVVKNIREKIISLGAQILFETKLESVVIEDEKIKSVILKKADNSQINIETDTVIMAIGHSARDTFEMLNQKGVKMEQKPFSVGARIEHKQSLINKSQYATEIAPKNLGAADYKLSAHIPNGRGVYTFCMCPGGDVVAAASEENTIVTNGMSEFSRSAKNANSALLVSVSPEDFKDDHPLAGMYFQREIERQAFKLTGSYKAPAQLVGDFLLNKASTKVQDVKPSYKPGVEWCNIGECLPEFVTNNMKLAIKDMERRLRGFSSYSAVLTAPETRSSSPVRILRNENRHSVNVQGLFPCGEGAGYAGGIMSAAVDGIRCAEQIISENIK